MANICSFYGSLSIEDISMLDNFVKVVSHYCDFDVYDDENPKGIKFNGWCKWSLKNLFDNSPF